jgi:hypothetical protein
LALLHLYQGLSDAAAGGASHLAMLRHELILHKKMPPEDDAELRRMCARWCDEAWDILTSAHLEPVDRPIHRDSDVKPRLLIGPEYTHFWTHFVPIYQKLAVQGVAEFLESIRASPDARFALEALQTGHRPATPPSAASSPPVGDSQH